MSVTFVLISLYVRYLVTCLLIVLRLY